MPVAPSGNILKILRVPLATPHREHKATKEVVVFRLPGPQLQMHAWAAMI
jgi:hypothetical protein